MHPPNPVRLLEYDQRFHIYGADFIRYDYRHPLDLPDSLAPGAAKVVLVDPPFLSEECFSKTAETVRRLAAPGARIVACTGTVKPGLGLLLDGKARLTVCRDLKRGAALARRHDVRDCPAGARPDDVRVPPEPREAAVQRVPLLQQL